MGVLDWNRASHGTWPVEVHVRELVGDALELHKWHAHIIACDNVVRWRNSALVHTLRYEIEVLEGRLGDRMIDNSSRLGIGELLDAITARLIEENSCVDSLVDNHNCDLLCGDK